MAAQADQSHGLFISYRRDDVPGHAGWLYGLLSEHFGESRVFMDVDSIGLGLDFVAALKEALAACKVMLVLIGPQWLSAQNQSSMSRADDRDYVRIEVRTALERGVPVVPVLIHGADLPPSESLPEPIRPLVRRQSARLGDATFRNDTRQLIERLEPVVTPHVRQELPVPVRSPAEAAMSWDATRREQDNPHIRRLRVTLSESFHEVEFELHTFRANVVRVNGKEVASGGGFRERYEFSLADGSATRTAVIEVDIGWVSIKGITLTVEGHPLYAGA